MINSDRGMYNKINYPKRRISRLTEAILPIEVFHEAYHTSQSEQWRRNKHYLFHVDFKGASRLTLRTSTRLDFLVLTLIERTQDKATLKTVILDHVELREYPCTAGDHPTRPNQLVQMQLPVGKGEPLTSERLGRVWDYYEDDYIAVRVEEYHKHVMIDVHI